MLMILQVISPEERRTVAYHKAITISLIHPNANQPLLLQYARDIAPAGDQP
jgi:hypothetical protein